MHSHATRWIATLKQAVAVRATLLPLVCLSVVALTAVDQQQLVTASIFATSRQVEEFAAGADTAVAAFTDALSSVTDAASATRTVGQSVRDQTSRLRTELNRIVEQLKAA